MIEVFASVQGEGYWTGVPMTFVRVAGCNGPELGLGCTRWCDTPASWDPGGGREMDVVEIVDQARLPRLCLTGGEPLLQIEGVGTLLAEAGRRETRVHLETNGTLDPPAGGLRFDWTVVSPKPPDYLIAPGWDGLVDELKLVVDESLDAATAERLAAAHPEAFVSIQPKWAQAPEPGLATARSAGWVPGHDRSSVERAITLVMTHPEWRFSPQVHKYVGAR